MKKVAFITGAGGYIGSETARVLAKNDIAIAVCDINEDTVRATVESIQLLGGEAFGRVLDVTDSADVDAAVNETVEKYGRLDIMVHIAGGSARIAGPKAKYALLVDQEDYIIDKVLKVNLYGAFYTSRAAARVMMKQGEGGKIINSVAPGVVCRPEVDVSTPEGRAYAYETNLLGEKCTAEDIANLVEFLVSDKARFITGQTYVCDGGRSLSMKGPD